MVNTLDRDKEIKFHPTRKDWANLGSLQGRQIKLGGSLCRKQGLVCRLIPLTGTGENQTKSFCPPSQMAVARWRLCAGAEAKLIP